MGGCVGGRAYGRVGGRAGGTFAREKSAMASGNGGVFGTSEKILSSAAPGSIDRSISRSCRSFRVWRVGAVARRIQTTSGGPAVRLRWEAIRAVRLRWVDASA